jgi:hypothetical protein
MSRASLGPNVAAGDVENVAPAPTHRGERPIGPRTKENPTMKYMLMMFGDATEMTQVQTPEWVSEMMGFMHSFNAELAATGELVEARGLAFPSTAKTVTRTDTGVTVTDGPFAEAKESLAGFWILDVADEARLVELATRVVRYAYRVEYREVPDAPPEP